jgi:hypothetical protein
MLQQMISPSLVSHNLNPYLNMNSMGTTVTNNGNSLLSELTTANSATPSSLLSGSSPTLQPRAIRAKRGADPLSQLRDSDSVLGTASLFCLSFVLLYLLLIFSFFFP